MPAPLVSPPAGGIFFHYTSRAAAQEMSISGQILPGRDGFTYLTDVLYRVGWQATDRLALPERNAEIEIAIPYIDLPRDDDGHPEMEYRGVVQPWPAAPGRAYRRDGGHEWVTRRPILPRVMPWSWSMPEWP
ncbi:MAG: hypothetical protein HYX51_07860 [Chloroflexi bacterium]|nr:hypothetical protein [Chloroflexota bacterium]